jgi:hypothetical protein
VVGLVAALGGVSFAAGPFGTAYLAAGAIFIMSIGKRSWKMQRQ